MAEQCLADQREVAPRIATAGQFHDVAAKHVVDVETGDAAERLVHGDQRVVRVEDHNAFAGRLEHRRSQALLLLHRLAGADVAARAQHTDDAATGCALHGAPAVFDPHPMPIAMTYPVLHLIVLAAAFEMLYQCVLEQWQIVGVQARFEVAEHRRDVFGLQAKQLLELRVVDLVGLQVPVPQAQFTGLQGHGQARFAFTQGEAGSIQLLAALRHTVLQADLGFTQVLLHLAALLDFAHQVLVQLLTALLRLL